MIFQGVVERNFRVEVGVEIEVPHEIAQEADVVVLASAPVVA